MVLQRKDGYFSLGEECHYRSEYEGEVVADGWHDFHPGHLRTIEIATAEALSSGRLGLGPSRDHT